MKLSCVFLTMGSRPAELDRAVASAVALGHGPPRGGAVEVVVGNGVVVVGNGVGVPPVRPGVPPVRPGVPPVRRSGTPLDSVGLVSRASVR